jgi:hypothetical protein
MHRSKQVQRTMNRITLLLLSVVFCANATAQSLNYRAPAVNDFAYVNPDGITVLPNGRFLTPTGERLYTGDDLWNVVPSPDGNWIVGFCDPGIVVFSSKDSTTKSNSYSIPSKNAAFCGLFNKDRFDATATDLSDMFTNTPDFTPYKYVLVDPRVFKPEDTFDPTDPKFERRRKEGPVIKMDDPDFVESLRNR